VMMEDLPVAQVEEVVCLVMCCVESVGGSLEGMDEVLSEYEMLRNLGRVLLTVVPPAVSETTSKKRDTVTSRIVALGQQVTAIHTQSKFFQNYRFFLKKEATTHFRSGTLFVSVATDFCTLCGKYLEQEHAVFTVAIC